MALLNTTNVFNATRGVLGLFSPLNKSTKKLDEEGTENFLVPEFESKMSDEDIRTLTARWTSEYETYSKDIQKQQKDNVNYWIGKQYNDIQVVGTKRPLVDNLLFEAVETFLPIATRGNPEANVSSPEDKQDELTSTVREILNYQATRQNLRMKLKGVTRNWMLYLIGCTKIIWDTQENDFDTKVILPSRLILDPHAEIGVDGRYYGDYLGEKKRLTARKLSRMFPIKKALIASKCEGQWGTKLTYIEWWTNTDVFFTISDEILGKYKNPHWNYDGEAEVKDPMTGAITKEQVEGKNHFPTPQIPYLFLSIFNLGKQPHDETSLIFQNIPLQDTINRRYQQIDRNVDGQNNGVVLSGKYFTKEQAAEAATQLSKGNPLWVPEGDIRASYVRDTAPALAGDVFKQLGDARDELRNIFGTSGSTPQGTESQKSVRGKILINQLDASRIGGGVTEYIEQLASSIFNWYVQMMYVYYTEERAFPAIGTKQTQKLLQLRNTDITVPLHVTVKSGSLIPKDPLTQRNEAMDLWSAGAIDPINFFTRLDFPNPYETAKELLTWQLIQKGALPPQVMFPDLQAQAPMATGVDQTNPITAGEAKMGLTQTETGAVDAPSVTSGQLLKSIPLPK